jgi:sigma-B regulation protein RsbU (phosphoserine phosphatase)
MLDTLKASLHHQLADRRARLERSVAEVGEAPDLIRLIKEVDDALVRLDGDGYAACILCHGDVDADVLEANPLTRYCLCDLTPERRRRLEQDLDLAGRIQFGLLPSQNVAFAGWRTHFRYHPEGPVSGDFVDLVARDAGDGDLFFLLGDVSGKGVAASILMGHLNALFRSLIDTGYPVHQLVEKANRIFSESTTSTQYATLVAGRAGASGDIEICNAGHFPPLLVRKHEIAPVDSSGFPVGIFGESPYAVHRIHLAPGDSLFLYTDGVTEARDEAGREYGEDRLIEVLSRSHGVSPATMASHALGDMEGFRGRTPLTDDVTVMVIQRADADADALAAAG